MSSVLPVLGALVAAAITPGPNNLIVMQAGARGGIAAAGAAILGVVSGSLVLLVLVWVGLDTLIEAMPILEFALGLAGGVYLASLGLSLFLRRRSSISQEALPTTLLGVATFQLLNPKAWMLIATAAAAMSDRGGLLVLIVLVVLVTSTCLSLWALAGAAAARLLAKPRARDVFERSMGVVLALSAVGIVIDAVLRLGA
jgi:threonine/homoserine/homoserine lactone efflux protein